MLSAPGLTDRIRAGSFTAPAGGFFIIGGQFMLNNVCAASYPVQARATGTGYLLGVGRIGGILGPYIGGWLLGVFGGTSVLFYAVAVAAALAVLTASILDSLS